MGRPSNPCCVHGQLARESADLSVQTAGMFPRRRKRPEGLWAPQDYLLRWAAENSGLPATAVFIQNSASPPQMISTCPYRELDLGRVYTEFVALMRGWRWIVVPPET
jgi:hypothetical protein